MGHVYKITWKYIRFLLIAVFLITVLLWGGNWILAKEYINPLARDALLGVIASGSIVGFLIPQNLINRVVGIIVGATVSYAYMLACYAYNSSMYDKIT